MLLNELDAAIARLRQIPNAPENPVSPSLQSLASANLDHLQHKIALCGGGGYMAYPLMRVKTRYAGIDTVTPRTIEERSAPLFHSWRDLQYLTNTNLSCLATLAGHRIYRLDQLLNTQISRIQLGITYPSTEDLRMVQWNDVSYSSLLQRRNSILEKSPWLMALSAQEPTRKNTFQFTAPRIPETQIHFVFVHTKGQPRPEQIRTNSLRKQGENNTGAIVWRLKFEGPPCRALHKQKYEIVQWTCDGKYGMAFKAYGKQHPQRELELVAEPYYCPM